MNVLVTLSLLFCIHSKNDNLDAVVLTGIWIPKDIDWSNPKFDTYCFIGDTTVVIFSSTQVKSQDSIVFNVDGNLTINREYLQVVSSSRFQIVGDPIGGTKARLKTKVSVTVNSADPTILIGGREYQRASLYTQASKEAILHLIIEASSQRAHNATGPNG